MPSNINILRISTRFHELFEEFIDMRDFPNDQQSHFETRALAATVLMIKCGLDPSGASSYITDGYRDMGIDAIYLDDNQKNCLLYKVNGAIQEMEPLLKKKYIHLLKVLSVYWNLILMEQTRKYNLGKTI